MNANDLGGTGVFWMFQVNQDGNSVRITIKSKLTEFRTVMETVPFGELRTMIDQALEVAAENRAKSGPKQ